MRYGMTLEQMKQELEKRLKPSRFRHSLGVAETAVKLAKRFGADEEQARVAGLVYGAVTEGAPAPIDIGDADAPDDDAEVQE